MSQVLKKKKVTLTNKFSMNVASTWDQRNGWKLFPHMSFLINSYTYTWIKLGKLHAAWRLHFLSNLSVYKQNASK